MKKKIQAIVQSYGIEVLEIEPVTKGFLSQNYIIVARDKKYFLKQYRPALHEDRIRDIHKSKAFFASAGVPALLPLLNSEGRTSVCHEGIFYALFPYAEGNTYPDQRCSLVELQSAARMLAKMHLVGATAPPNFIAKTFDRVRFDEAIAGADAMLGVIRGRIEQPGYHVTPFDQMAIRVVQEKRAMLASWPFSLAEVGDPILVHYDLHVGNMFFDDVGAVRHVFDFELTKSEPAEFDVARMLTITCFDGGAPQEMQSRMDAYLRAYREVHPLHDEKLRAGVLEFVLHRTASFWVEEEHYIKGNTRVDQFLEIDELSRRRWFEWLRHSS